MLKHLVNACLIIFLILSLPAVASDAYLDKTKLIGTQVELLKDRLQQAKNELQNLQQQPDNLTLDHVNKRLLGQAALEISVAKSMVDGVSVELFESQQAINRLQNDAQELQNQLNVFSIVSRKAARAGAPDLVRLRAELDYQTNLLLLEKRRADYLSELQDIADTMRQVYKARYAHIDSLLKSQTVIQLKEQQAKSEVHFQQQQSVWLQKLNYLNAELIRQENLKHQDGKDYTALQSEIFYVNERVNFTYLEMMIARYQDQMQQLRVSMSRTTSITLLNQAAEQTQTLAKQFIRMNHLLETHVDILLKRKQLSEVGSDSTDLDALTTDYKQSLLNVNKLSADLVTLRASLELVLQQELSSRQGLPGFNVKAWLDLGGEIMVVPTLGLQVIKNLSFITLKDFSIITQWGWAIVAALEFLWVSFFIGMHYFLRRIVGGMPDHEFGHINPRWLFIKLLHRNLIDFALLGNIAWLLPMCGVPLQSFNFLIHLGLVWLCFKIIIMMARLCLVETVHDRAGHDVRLYYQLKWVFLVGGIVTALTVFIYTLPVIYEVKDFFSRLFLLFLLVASVFLLKQWEMVPGLILAHIDERRTYMKRIVRLLGLLIPLVLFINSLIGLFGYVNLILTISWYESIFLLVLVGYLIIRGLLSDVMEWVSHLLIRHVTNGWLWTEAFLKPIDRVLRIVLFLTAWVVLFLFYGWDSQSPVVERLNKLLYYHLVDMLNTSITPYNIIELTVVMSLLYWAARWTREFVYRLLFSRTTDLGLRNSIAVFSQYAMILIGLFICLRVLGIDFRALAVVAGMLAFGVGLGLRDLANNFVCGFLLLIERPVRVGDTIAINGCEGEVTHIGSRAVTIRTWDHMEVLVPNAEIFSKAFTNWTGRDSIVRTVLAIKINRHDSPRDVQALIYQVLSQHKDILLDPAPEVFLKEFSDGLSEFEVRYFINIRQVSSRIGVRSEILMAIWGTFESHGIQPPYPHHEVYVKSGMPLLTPTNR